MIVFHSVQSGQTLKQLIPFVLPIIICKAHFCSSNGSKVTNVNAFATSRQLFKISTNAVWQTVQLRFHFVGFTINSKFGVGGNYPG
jgi:hypothetical protein